jgi:DNA-binding transcriptional LysR family regulator
MNMTFAQIRTFVCIVRAGSFHAAARTLGLTQPSVSQRIRELESALGTALFIRRGPRVNLSAEGHAFVDQAERLLEDADAIVARFRMRDPLKGVLRLGLNESFALICLSELLRRLEAQHPDLKTSVHVGDTGAVSRLLNERKLDVAIVSQPDLEPHVRALPIGTNEMGWIAGAGLSLPAGVLSPAALARFHLTISPPTARLYTTAMNWFADAGVVPPRVSTCNTLSVTSQAILGGVTIGLVPVRVMQAELERGEAKLVPVSPPIVGHRVFLCYQASDLGPSLERVLVLMRELIAHKSLFT